MKTININNYIHKWGEER